MQDDLKVEISQKTDWILLKFGLKLQWPNQGLQTVKMKKKSNRRWLENTERGGPNQPMLILMRFRGNPWGIPRLNLECGPAQPSLFSKVF